MPEFYELTPTLAETFAEDGVVFIPKAIDKFWIDCLDSGIQKNVNTPTERGEAAAPSGIGLIWKLNLLILLAFACYFGLGFLYKSRRHGAQGLEAVPHLETWKELPYLVRDGVIFSVDTIKSKGRASYDPVL